MEPDPTQEQPDLSAGSWLIFHSNWEKPIDITFYNAEGRNKFYLGSDIDNADKEMTGQFSVAGENLNHQVFIYFDKDINTIHEFDWQRSFNWQRQNEPKSRLKAVDEKFGFYLWKNAVKSRAIQKQKQQQQFEQGQNPDARFNQDGSQEDVMDIDLQNQRSLDAYEADLMKQIFEPPEPDIKPGRARKNLVQPSGSNAEHKRVDFANAVYKSRRMKTIEVDELSAGDSNDTNVFGSVGSAEGSSRAKVQTYENIQRQDTKEKPHQAFLDFQSAFENMIDSTFVTTEDIPVVSLLITNDNSTVIITSKVSDHESIVKQYDLQANKWVFREQYGGNEFNFIRLKDVAQNRSGELYACPYFDDGVFKIRTFDKEQRPMSKAMEEEINLNKELELNNFTMVNEDFFDPNIVCCFLSDQQLFVNLFHNFDKLHYHFVYDVEYRQVLKLVQFEMKDYCTAKNFPMECFYDYKNEMVYSFYRQGQAFNIQIDSKDEEDFTFTKSMGSDLGQMTLYKDEILISQNSSVIMFFKRAEADNFSTRQEGEWYNYHTINCRGFVSWHKGNDFVKIVSTDLIYYYDIQVEDKMPVLQNVMKNYMKCTNLETSHDQQFCVAYRVNQEEFEIFKRKRNHQFQVQLDERNFENSQILELETIGIIVVSQHDSLLIFDCETLVQIDEIKLPLPKSKTREPEQIIGLQKSQDEQLLAIVTGKTLITQEQNQSALFILQRQRDNTFSIKHQIPASKLQPFFIEVNMNYFFKKNRNEIIIFCREDRIFMINYETLQMKTIHRFTKMFDKQPHTFICNADQTVYLMATNKFCNYFNMNTGTEIQLNSIFHTNDFRGATYDSEEKMFYLSCNRQHDRIGFYLLKFRDHDPSRFKNVTQWRHKLEIGDVQMDILRGYDQSTKNYYKELVIGYKTIYHNVYTVHVQDLSGPDNTRNALFRHESYHIWEYKAQGLLVKRNQCHINLSHQGIKLIYLGTQPLREINTEEGETWILHSLDKFSYLKLDKINFLSYGCEDLENMVIRVQQEYVANGSDEMDYQYANLAQVETIFEPIYNLNINTPLLSELLIIESFFESRTTAEILKLIRLQPNPGLFYKSFLELDGANLTSILASDSICTEILLNDEFSDFFSDKFPIIYKIIFTDADGNTKYTSAIDIAVKNDQIKAIGTLIDYIVKYQNTYVSSYLFMSNLGLLIGKGVNMYPLFTSSVFLREFDYDQWPGVHDDDTTDIRPYNESIFHLRDHYKTVFEEEKFQEMDPETMGNTRVFKIKYTINMLPQFFFGHVDSGDDDGSLWDELKDDQNTVTGAEDEPGYDKIDYFTAQSIKQVIDFKWKDGAKGQIFFNFFLHGIYVILLIDYVWCIYIRELYGLTEIESDFYKENLKSEILSYSVIMCIYLLYPLGYESIQASLAGIKDYLGDPYNYGDILNIGGGALHIIIANLVGPHGTAGRITLIFMTLASSFKLFMLLRVFSSIAPVVVILKQSMFDLRFFLMIMFLMIFILGLVIAATGLSNQKQPGALNDLYGGDKTFQDALDGGMPSVEYYKIPGIFKFFLEVFNLTVGNFAVISSNVFLDETLQTTFWIIFLVAVTMLMIVFLNFVVAKAMASHSEATGHMEAVINKEKADMIDEVESLAWERYRNPQSYPRFLVKRTVEL